MALLFIISLGVTFAICFYSYVHGRADLENCHAAADSLQASVVFLRQNFGVVYVSIGVALAIGFVWVILLRFFSKLAI
jgi:hypothetical protein